MIYLPGAQAHDGHLGFGAEPHKGGHDCAAVPSAQVGGCAQVRPGSGEEPEAGGWRPLPTLNLKSVQPFARLNNIHEPAALQLGAQFSQ